MFDSICDVFSIGCSRFVAIAIPSRLDGCMDGRIFSALYLYVSTYVPKAFLSLFVQLVYLFSSFFRLGLPLEKELCRWSFANMAEYMAYGVG